jgi:hypothetical protein
MAWRKRKRRRISGKQWRIKNERNVESESMAAKIERRNGGENENKWAKHRKPRRKWHISQWRKMAWRGIESEEKMKTSAKYQ